MTVQALNLPSFATFDDTLGQLTVDSSDTNDAGSYTVTV